MKKNDNVVNKNTKKLSIKTKHLICLSLHVQRQIFKIYKRHVELLLISMRYYDKFRSINFLYIELMKLINRVDCIYIFVIDYRVNNIRL